MAIQPTRQRVEPTSPPLGPTPRRAWLFLRTAVVLGFLAYGWLKGYQPAVLLAVVIIGPWALLHWLRGGEVEPVRTGVVEEWENPCDFGPTERQKLCDPAYNIYPHNVAHRRIWEKHQ